MDTTLTPANGARAQARSGRGAERGRPGPKRAGENARAPSARGGPAPMRLHALAIGFAIALLLVLGALSAADPGIPTLTGNNFFNSGGNYGPVIQLLTIGLATLSFCIAILYMMAGLLKQPEWEAFIKTELYQVVISVVWGVFLLGAAVLVDGVTSRMAMSYQLPGSGGGTPVGLFDIAQGHLSRVICLSSTTTLKLEGLKVAAQFLAGLKSRYYVGPWGSVVPTFPGFEVVERALELVQTLITPFTSSLFVQTLGLDIIHGTALTFLLPVGILLRIAPPTREAGSFLIAAAFGLYFVLPFTYLINAQVMNQMYYNQYGYNMCSGSEGQGASFMTGTRAFYDSTASQMLPNLKEDFIGNGAFTQLLSYVSLQAVFLPALNMVLVVSFIRSATKFFSQKLD